MTPPKHPRDTTPPTSYQITVRGELSRRYRTAFEGMTLIVGNGHTTITGPVLDQTHLHGLLDRAGDLGLEIVSVNATPPPSDRATEQPTDTPPPNPGISRPRARGR